MANFFKHVFDEIREFFDGEIDEIGHAGKALATEVEAIEKRLAALEAAAGKPEVQPVATVEPVTVPQVTLATETPAEPNPNTTATTVA